MKNKLFIIGNGLDIAHGLPTNFDPDFKNIATEYEQDNFWELYQSQEANIWADFENLLSCPDFNALVDIFDGYSPDYLSDRESDRNSIIFQVDLNGRLMDALYEFADIADEHLRYTQANELITQKLDTNALYMTFNYTHTLERLYNIPKQHILHIHGEVGHDNLELGYPEGTFSPEKYYYDVRGKGRGPYRAVDFEKYIDNIEDYYINTAYKQLFAKCKSFSKEIRIDLLHDFLDKNTHTIKEIIVYGHSCEIDFDYFNYLNIKYPTAHWVFYVKNTKQQYATITLITDFCIQYAEIIKI